MSLDHRGGNGQPMMDREEHKHRGDNENEPAGKGIISLDKYAMRVQTSGTDTYIGQAVPGSGTGDSVWRAQKIDADGNTTWADGNANFDNVATDLTALSYS